MTFTDRKEAGQQLAKALTEYKGKDVIVYALPRGGVVLGFEVAQELGVPLDLIITRKIGHPLSSEFAVCAITESGELLCDEAEKAALDSEFLKEAVKRETEEAKRRREIYLPEIKHISATGKVAIIVDDGLATGLTMRAAVQAIKKENPKELIVAVPVASPRVVEILQKEVDTVMVLGNDEGYFVAIGDYYENFGQVSDEEVVELLKKSQL